ncbi:hypothetical protein KAR91_05475, partial [Candidatus Pacearchaeota archaeon]|nr:hypothetical protein [Candidatus Pacearchaeota archaeon]
IPHVEVWHDRQATNLHKSPLLARRITKARDDKSVFTKENSFFGQQVVMQKNFNPDFSLKVRTKSLGYKIAALTYASLFERYLLKQLKIVREFKEEIKGKQDQIKFRMPPSHIERLMK